MRSIAGRLILAGVVGCVAVISNAHDSRSVVAAQQRTPVTLTRIFTGSDGQTHAEQVDVKLLR